MKTSWLAGTEPGPLHLAQAAALLGRPHCLEWTAEFWMRDTLPRALLLKPRHAHEWWSHYWIWGRRQENKTHSDQNLTQNQTHHNPKPFRQHWHCAVLATVQSILAALVLNTSCVHWVLRTPSRHSTPADAAAGSVCAQIRDYYMLWIAGCS